MHRAVDAPYLNLKPQITKIIYGFIKVAHNNHNVI